MGFLRKMQKKYQVRAEVNTLDDLTPEQNEDFFDQLDASAAQMAKIANMQNPVAKKKATDSYIGKCVSKGKKILKGMGVTVNSKLENDIGRMLANTIEESQD